MTATLAGPDLDVSPGSEAWLALMTASKIAGVVGVSPYESRRSLWHKMRGEIPHDDGTNADAKLRGHYLEPAILAWWHDQHPTWERLPSGTFIDGWTAATPDSRARTDDGEIVEVEAKSWADDDDFGTQGTDEIPTHIAAQCQWTMLVTGARRCYVPLLTERLEFREYIVDVDAAIGATLLDQARAFMTSLLPGNEPPPVDSHKATCSTLRALHPDIDPGADGKGLEVEISPELRDLYFEAQLAFRSAEADKRFAASSLAEALGNGRRAVCGGDRIAYRAPKAGGAPVLSPQPKAADKWRLARTTTPEEASAA